MLRDWEAIQRTFQNIQGNLTGVTPLAQGEVLANNTAVTAPTTPTLSPPAGSKENNNPHPHHSQDRTASIIVAGTATGSAAANQGSLFPQSYASKHCRSSHRNELTLPLQIFSYLSFVIGRCPFFNRSSARNTLSFYYTCYRNLRIRSTFC